MKNIIVVEDFCPNFAEHKKVADAAVYTSIELPHQRYNGFALQMTHWAYEKLATIVGFPVTPCLDYFRKYERGMQQDTFIHSDRGVAKYTAVLSLQNNNGGLAFWKYKSGEDQPLLGCDYRQSGLDESQWVMTRKIEMKENLCVIYPADIFHSRYPKDWNEDYARHIQVFFFNPARP